MGGDVGLGEGWGSVGLGGMDDGVEMGWIGGGGGGVGKP
jgi:hypothetical protein